MARLLPTQHARYKLWGEPREASGPVPEPRSVFMPLNPGLYRRGHRKLTCPSLAERAY